MSIVDKELKRHEAETKALLSGAHTFESVGEHSIRQVKELINLARELEAHCEAMAGYVESDYRSTSGADLTNNVVLDAWQKFKAEHE